MRRFSHPFLLLAPGLVCAQIVFSVVVYLSNTDLYNCMGMISASGYLPVPNILVFPMLQSVKTAFCGAVFFTLTVGAGLCCLSFLWAWIVSRIGLKHGAAMLFALLPLALFIAALNANGFNPAATLAALFIPVPVFILSARRFKNKKSGIDVLRAVVHIAIILVLGLSWFAQADRDMFINIRDYVLFSNPAGKAVNDFYYKYTLFPAEVFKSYDQKLLKTCRLETGPGFDVKKIKKALIKNDYLPVVSNTPVDLVLVEKNSELAFFHGGKKLLVAPVHKFLSDPKKFLSMFSDKCDTNVFFRKFTFFSLLCALPFIFYLMVHFLFCTLFLWIKNPRARDVWAAVSCLVLGLAFILPLYRLPVDQVPKKELKQKLASSAWPEQRAALKTIEESGFDPMRYANAKALAKSPHVPVRYWLARALGNSRQPEAGKILKQMFYDPSPNVVCMACYAMGRRHYSVVRPLILELIVRSDHAYVQWYAYKALRKTGWIQSGLD
ncbi:MAG: HEAT repeat domain-containing protein [Deltaproteobacteria bacterium]|nr:HEAT repeat domain-containing protein [Deltaproteobacteria bacterium]